MALRILLIEDDPDVSETIRTVLENFYEMAEVKHISNGDQFKMGKWRESPWDLVVLDLMMPGITGFEVCETLKRHSATRKIPVLALTGYDTLQNEERIKKAGADGYMAKPFEVSHFLKEVDRLVGVKGGAL